MELLAPGAMLATVLGAVSASSWLFAAVVGVGHAVAPLRPRLAQADAAIGKAGQAAEVHVTHARVQ